MAPPRSRAAEHEIVAVHHFRAALHAEDRRDIARRLADDLGGIAASVLSVWMVPVYGWQSMFYLGAVPAILALSLRTLLPESRLTTIS